jgi:hypothetical protein
VLTVKLYLWSLDLKQAEVCPRIAELHKSRATKFCAVTPNICGSARNLLHIIIMTPRIFKVLLDFWKIDAPLCY